MQWKSRDNGAGFSAVGEAKPRQRRAEPTEGMPYDSGTAQAVADMKVGWDEAVEAASETHCCLPLGNRAKQYTPFSSFCIIVLSICCFFKKKPENSEKLKKSQ